MMNQLEHLKALRDKARIQTEQAKAVLQQQGEISESLDRLIAALEGKGDVNQAGSAALAASEPAAPATESNSLGQMIANLEDSATPKESSKPGIVGAAAAAVGAGGAVAAVSSLVSGGKDDASKEIVWETEAAKIPALPQSDSSTQAAQDAPKLEPIVWEVSGEKGEAAGENGNGSENPGSKFKFLKLGEGDGVATELTEQAEEAVQTATDEAKEGETSAIAGIVGGGVAAAAVAGAASLLGRDKDDSDDETFDNTVAIAVPDLNAPPAPITVAENIPTPPPLPTVPIPAALPAVAVPVVSTRPAGPVVSNIFFDANSAYLKDSELNKLKATAEAIGNSDDRVLKIQGLEDLASSNDFKELLASRRMLAVKKKLAEHGVADAKIAISDIQLSDEGRILSPPSLVIAA